MEIQLKSSMNEMDDLRESVETLQEKVDETKAEGAKQKQRTRAVARIAVKKQKITKAEVHRLRDQMDGMRKEWMSPQVKKELKNQLEKGKKKIKSLKNELLVRTKIKTFDTKEDKEEIAATKEMESELKAVKVKLKKLHVESRRKEVAMKELRHAHTDEMKEKKLISDYFYNNQKETMSFMGINDSYKDYIYLFLGLLIITVGLGYMGIIVSHEMEQLGNNSLSEL